MIKVEDMNVFDCLTSTDSRCFVTLVLPGDEIHQGCPDDILRSLRYEDVGTNVKSMGFDFEQKSITFKC